MLRDSRNAGGGGRGFDDKILGRNRGPRGRSNFNGGSSMKHTGIFNLNRNSQ